MTLTHRSGVGQTRVVCAGFWSLSSAAVGRFWELAGEKNLPKTKILGPIHSSRLTTTSGVKKRRKRGEKGKGREGKGREREIRLLQQFVMLLHD